MPSEELWDDSFVGGAEGQGGRKVKTSANTAVRGIGKGVGSVLGSIFGTQPEDESQEMVGYALLAGAGLVAVVLLTK